MVDTEKIPEHFVCVMATSDAPDFAVVDTGVDNGSNSLAKNNSLRLALVMSFILHMLAAALVYYWWQQSDTTPTRMLTLALTLDGSEHKSQHNQSDSEQESIESTDETVAGSAEQLVVEAPTPTPTESLTPTEPQAASTKPSSQPGPIKEIQAAPVQLPDVRIATFVVNESITREFEVYKSEPQTLAMSDQQKSELRNRIDDWQDEFQDLLVHDEPIRWQSDGLEFVATVDVQQPLQPTGFERATVTVSTIIDEQLVATEMEFKRLSFSHYAQLVNRWDPDVLFSKDDIDGRFHSNSGFKIEPQQQFQPRFTGMVTVASRLTLSGRVDRDQVFQGGLDHYAEKIHLPGEISGFNEQSQTLLPEQLTRFDKDATIIFLADGQFYWHRPDDPTQTVSGRLHESGHYFLAEDDVELQVKGIVRGSVVVYSPEKITIVGDLIYDRNPFDYPDSQDFMGLLSDKYVEVAHPDVIGPGDLEIHAAIFAKRRFVVRRFKNRNNGVMTVVGSVTAGSLSATEPRYATRVRFDKRFEQMRPLHFPMTERFELQSWDSTWRVIQ